MNRLFYLLTCSLLIASTACRKNNADTPRSGKDLDLTTAESQKVMADNQFSFNLFKNVAPDNSANQDLFISPLSVSFAFGMLANGSNGQTQTDIYKTMNYTGFSESAINTYYGKLITGLPLVDDGASLNIANSIWYKQGFSVQSAFLQANSTYYKAGVQALDFANPSAVQTINNWVSTNTKGKIPTIIDAIPDGTVMFLINAIYFKDQWEQRFDAAKTHKQAFYLPDNSTVQGTFMQGDVNVKTTGDELGRIMELPYVGKKFSMLMIQPTGSHTMQELIAGLDTVRWNGWMKNLISNRVTLTMPKFKFSFEKKLNSTLINMGMGIAFGDSADFSRISTGGGLAISEVKHKAFVEVTEDGTEAAAVTSIGVTLTSGTQPTAITLDHPFLFIIREVKTGLILFTGIMNNPNETGS